MKIHEYQAIKLFREYNIRTTNGQVAETPDVAREIALNCSGPQYVVKAQVHSGGRGKAGGVKLVDSPDEVFTVADKMIGQILQTNQTGSTGLVVQKVLVYTALNITSEYYLGFTIDRENDTVTLIASSEGGVEIEEVARNHPEKLVKKPIDRRIGVRAYQMRDVADQIGLEKPEIIDQFVQITQNLYRLFLEKDCNTVEINPLVVTGEMQLCALDAKIVFDDNALYKHPDIASLADRNQADLKENQAADLGVNYVALKGKIGCMVNGAGLAMATMDIVQFYGGEPANFLDVGGGATVDKIVGALEILVSDRNVSGILINIFGGIIRCDTVAEGIITAVKKFRISLPIVVRLKGTHELSGKKLLEQSNLNVFVIDDLTEATHKIIFETSVVKN